MTINRTRLVWAILFVASFLGLSACGEKEEYQGRSRRVVAVKDVPADVLKAAKAALPEIEFQDAWSNHGPEGQLESYEVRGRASNGKIREVRVSTAGKVLEME